MDTHKTHSFTIALYQRPGQTLDDTELDALSREIREIAAACFHTIPEYQAMEGTRKALSDKLITLARDAWGRPVGFCSMVFLDVPDVGTVLHLGLTCVHPDARGRRLTHRLVKKALTRYLFRQNPFGRVWISNCAAVLSSLGNVALNFDGVYPSPLINSRPGPDHLKIARAIDSRFRDRMFIPDQAVLDEKRFVFRGSVKDTVFHKERDDLAFHHRKNGINRFYANMMNFEQGDEVLQIGYFRMASVLKYLFRQRRMKKNAQAQTPVLEN